VDAGITTTSPEPATAGAWSLTVNLEAAALAASTLRVAPSSELSGSANRTSNGSSCYDAASFLKTTYALSAPGVCAYISPLSTVLTEMRSNATGARFPLATLRSRLAAALGLDPAGAAGCTEDPLPGALADPGSPSGANYKKEQAVSERSAAQARARGSRITCSIVQDAQGLARARVEPLPLGAPDLAHLRRAARRCCPWPAARARCW
jgi:hypothetical protein